MAKKARRKKKVTAKKKRAPKRAKKRVARKKKIVKRKVARKGAKKKAGRAGAKRRVGKGRGLPSEPIGRVTHYFSHVKAAAVIIDRDGIRVGDTLYIKGHTTRFKQRVDSLQIEHAAVSQASPGDEVGIRVSSRVREHDLVFKL